MKIGPQAPGTRTTSDGFTLIELLVVMGIAMVLVSVSVFNVLPAIRNSRVENALQTTLMQTRRARQSAIDERRVYVVTFVLPRTIEVRRRETDLTLTLLSQIALPNDISFRVVPGIPTNPLEIPDGFGTGADAIDFNGSNRVFFQPDGSAQDATGRPVNGIVYLARTGELTSSRAVTAFGATGRLRGWKLAERTAGTLAWR